MKGQLRLATCILGCALSLGFSTENSLWKQVSPPAHPISPQVIRTHPRSGEVWVAGPQGIAPVHPANDNILRPVPSIRLEDVRDFLFPGDDRMVIVTRTHVWGWDLGDGERQALMDCSRSGEGECFAAVFDDDDVYLATSHGLFRGREGVWMRVPGMEHPVYLLEKAGARIAAAEENRVVVYHPGSGERAFITVSGGSLDEDEDVSMSSAVKAMRYQEETDELLVASKREWTLVDLTEGTWRPMSLGGLPADEVIRILRPALNLWAAVTAEGIYFRTGDRWSLVSQGMGTGRLNDATVDDQGRVHAATDRGVFRLETGSASGESLPPEDMYLPYSQGSRERELAAVEPAIRDVQHWAIDYAEVHPDKVTHWRQEVQRRAWWPKVSVGMGYDRDWSYSDSLWGSYTSGGQHYVGPDDKSFGKDIGFDLGLSWDLGDLVWNSAQLSIDTRSKLVVELREDILDEVTRIYFERRRLQLSDPQDPGRDAVLNRQLRVEELTALLDGYTDGKFSAYLERRESH